MNPPTSGPILMSGAMVRATRGYYLNGLYERKAKLQKEHRLLMARYGRMERLGHPSLCDQGLLIDLNKQFLAMLDAALAEANAASHPVNIETRKDAQR